MSYPRNPVYDEAWTLYQSGSSLEQCASSIGVTRQSVFCAFRQRGYQMREKSLLPYMMIMGKKFTRRHDGHYRMTLGSRCTAQKYVWEHTSGRKVPPGWCVVHVDRNAANNSPDNLECVPRSEASKYSVHNNIYSKGRKQNPVVNKFCVNCGKRIVKGTPSYRIERDVCSPRCLGEFRRGTPKGLNIEQIAAHKSRKRAERLIFSPDNPKFKV